MNSFKIIHAFFLQSNQKLMAPSTIYAPTSDAEVTELREFATRGGCEEMLPMKKAKAEKPAEPTDDITVVPGIGKKLMTALAELGITTKTGLKDKLEDAAVKEALGLNFEKIAKYFADSPAV